ncbi:glucosaminidase domain-containing protein [Thermosipho ferrireducens]|uniref:Glucosaminidase domain-containing protein n=1 Tax=Thermosipho ferrireducens TaxID=2571116 RepID=A0ABX7S6G4_9BACT|nr:glucosaminidase domain-containing protein [Thermosipho ferrireducens]QTA38167.1 glucosaminidase domain-containing protein [Thermosipho ferrireducens]
MKKLLLFSTFLLVAFFIVDIYFVGSSFIISTDVLKAQIIPDVVEVEFESWKDLKNYFDEIGYYSYKNPPNIIVKRLPEDLSAAPIAVRKEIFVKVMVPIIRKVNSEILQERQNLFLALEKGQSDYINYLMKKYKAKNVKDLLLKVDVIPEDLALAQAALESAWGTSRFAIEANNIFGEWTFTPGTGLVPKERPENATYEIRIFPDLISSMESYAMNLNSLPYYETFRLIRAGKKKGHPADGLVKYSELGTEYVELVKLIINNLP